MGAKFNSLGRNAKTIFQSSEVDWAEVDVDVVVHVDVSGFYDLPRLPGCNQGGIQSSVEFGCRAEIHLKEFVICQWSFVIYAAASLWIVRS